MVIAVIEAEDDRKPIALIIITVITISITLYLLLLALGFSLGVTVVAATCCESLSRSRSGYILSARL